MKLRPLAIAALGMSPLCTLALGPGDIAFTGFNADGNDDLAFVALVPIPGGEVIFFTDNEWNGSALTTGEGTATWTAPLAGIAAGDIVTLNDLSGTETTSIGAITVSGSFNMGGSNEGVLAYQGTDASTPTSFLAIIGNDSDTSTGFGDLTGTGLANGVDAIFITGDEDIMAYTGARIGEASFADYLPLLVDSLNWITQDGSGDQSGDATAPDLPFDSTAFVTGGTAPVDLFLSLDLPDISENAGSTTLSIFRDGPTTSAATVNLTSSDLGEATVPATADFIIGQDTVDVTVTGVDDSIFDGSQLVTLTGGGAGFFDGTTDLTVTDDFADTADLIVNEIYPNNYDLDINGDGIASNDDEFLELVNTTGASLDISGWTVSDGSSVRHTFTPGTVLDTDCAILVFDDLPATTNGINGTAAVAASSGSLNLNSTDTVTIMNDSAVLIMTSSYESFFVADTALDSLNLETEITPSAYIDHSGVTGSGGAQLSPGTKVDGSVFCVQPALTFSAAPTSFTEDTVGTASTGTVTASPTPTSDLTVTLTSGDVSEATVPATVTIIANTPSITFPITAVDDLEVDGDILVTISGTATSYIGGLLSVTVQDDGDIPIVPNLSPGSIAITGFNADGDDNIAFVALEDIDEGQVIFFTDEEWNGLETGLGGAFNTGEGTISWICPIGGIDAGDIVRIDNADGAPAVTSDVGTTNTEDSGFNLSGGGESLYAYQGTDYTTVTAFVALLATRTTDSIVNTGLTADSTAIYLNSNADGGAYNGSRSISPTFAGYLALIGDTTSNWVQDGSEGTQYVPFSDTKFTLGTGDAYDFWANDKGLTLGVNDGAEDDAENGGVGDGIANVLEFILNGDPLAVDPSILPAPSVDATDFIFTFDRRIDSTGITTVTFQWSTDLSFPGANDVVLIAAPDGTPDGNGVAVSILSTDGTVDSLEVRVPRTNATDGKIFGRLMGTRP